MAKSLQVCNWQIKFGEFAAVSKYKKPYNVSCDTSHGVILGGILDCNYNMAEVVLYYSFTVSSMIRGYHVYKDIWENPITLLRARSR